MKRIIAVFVLILAGAVASAQPNLSYSFVRDQQGRPVIGKGARPVVTGEMGIPTGTPFFDTTDNALYYWSGSAWTNAGNGTGGTTFSGPILIPDGTLAAPGLGFAAASGFGFVRSGSGILDIANGSNSYLRLNGGALILGATGTYNWTSTNADGTVDLRLYRDAAATLQIGPDAASATSQTFKGADSTGNGTAGGILTIRGGAGTAGDAKGGNLNLIGGDNFGTGEEGVVVIVDGGTKPTCAAANRGAFWYDQGGAGVADTFEVCAKAAAGDTYAWRSIATIP